MLVSETLSFFRLKQNSYNHSRTNCKLITVASLTLCLNCTNHVAATRVSTYTTNLTDVNLVFKFISDIIPDTTKLFVNQIHVKLFQWCHGISSIQCLYLPLIQSHGMSLIQSYDMPFMQCPGMPLIQYHGMS